MEALPSSTPHLQSKDRQHDTAKAYIQVLPPPSLPQRKDRQHDTANACIEALPPSTPNPQGKDRQYDTVKAYIQVLPPPPLPTKKKDRQYDTAKACIEAELSPPPPIPNILHPISYSFLHRLIFAQHTPLKASSIKGLNDVLYKWTSLSLWGALWRLHVQYLSKSKLFP